MPAPVAGTTPPFESASIPQALTPESTEPSSSMEPASSVPVAASQGPSATMPQVIRLGRSKGAQILDMVYTQSSDGLYFPSIYSATAAMTMGSWQSPRNDATIPNTTEEDQEVVRRLVDAFMDLSSALDTPDNAYRKRFTPGSTAFYKPWTVERCAWDILVSQTVHNTMARNPR